VLDRGNDQAAGLRRMVGAPSLSLMAFPVAPEAGVWIAQLAHTLRAMGARPVVIDAGRGGAVTRALGLNPRHELMDLLNGAAGFEAVAQVTPDGVWGLRAERGLEAFAASGAPSRQLFSGFARLSQGFDAVLLAMPAGELACLASPAQAVPVIVLEGGDSGLVRAYATLKELAAGFGYTRFALVTRGSGGAAQARLAHARLAAAAQAFLNAEVSLAGWLPEPGGDAQAQLADLAQTLLHTAATPLDLH
jgi:flagellar biosynthesis protein FlhG